MSACLRIAPGRQVSLHLEVRFADGFVALSTFAEEPIRCTIGDGTLHPGLEERLGGLAAGTEEAILDDGSELFGVHDPDNIHWLDTAGFAAPLDPARGQVIVFQTPDGEETGGLVLVRIRDGEGDRVQVDFNHPFAGRPLALRVKVLTVD